MVVGAEIKGKPIISIMISDNLTRDYDLHAGNMVREMAKEIKGGGGGQPFYATAGGKDISGLDAALKKGEELINHKLGQVLS